MRSEGDELHRQRHKGGGESTTHVHSGSCHCRRVRFRIRAGSKLSGVDIKSKIRFPRVTIPIESFEALTDDSMMSHYAVKSGGSIGIYTFCSFCGVHVVFAPSIDPSEVQVNMDCVDRTNVRDESVTYMTAADTSPCSATSEAARNINRKGAGSISSASRAGEEESPAPAIASMVAMLGTESPDETAKGLGWSSAEKNGTKDSFNVNDYLSSIPGMGSIGSPAASPGHNGDRFSPPVTPAKSKFAFDSPIHKQLLMHKQLQKHLKQYLEPNEMEN